MLFDRHIRSINDRMLTYLLELANNPELVWFYAEFTQFQDVQILVGLWHVPGFNFPILPPFSGVLTHLVTYDECEN